MSLALYASPFNNNDNNESSDTNIYNSDNVTGKKKIHNKTIRKVNKNDNKVNSILEEIHNSNIEDDENNLGDFNPPPKPDSAGVNKTIATEQANNSLKQKNTEMFSIMNAQLPQGMSSLNEEQLLLNSYNSSNNKETVDNYYKSFMPTYQNSNNNKQYYQSGYQTNPNDQMMMDSNQDILLQKLNYVIHLLEEKQDEKTNNVMEEVILYSFLGIFIIFVIDSFSKTGKYSR